LASRVVWSDRARGDLREIVTYIAQDSPAGAAAVSRRIVVRTRHLPDHPRQGRRLPEAPEDDCLRELIIESWRIIYRVEATQIEIAAIIHTARLLRNLPSL